MNQNLQTQGHGWILLFYALAFFVPALLQAQPNPQPQRFGTFEITLPAGWQYDSGSSAGEFHTFRYAVNGKTG